MEGLLNINKRSGATSFDVVEAVRHLSGERRVGHTGTLDRNAGGVLVVLVGRATKIVRFLTEDEKEYVGTVRLGSATDTDDSTGKVIRQVGSFSIPMDEIKSVVDSFKGEIEQIPPAYSSVKVRGRRLHELARRGTPVEGPPRKVEIEELEIVDLRDRELKIRVVCSKGTYMRALARDIGERLGCFGHLQGLVRVRVGENVLKNSIDIDRVCEVEKHMMSMKDALRRYPIVSVSAGEAGSIRCGRKVEVTSLNDDVTQGSLARICIEGADFLGLGRIEKDVLVPVRVLA
ncbi:MAG: tRNA pseudouridine(55) synthase TruB [bacterium]